jgi:hypothetical protein
LSSDIWQLLSTTTRLVPVVFGGINYVEVLPHDAYIDALNQSPSSLAQTLIYLSKNEDDFAAYLNWRNRYSLSVQEWPCFVCQALTEKLSKRFHKNNFEELSNKFSTNIIEDVTNKFPKNNYEVGSIQLASEGLCTSWPHLNFADNNFEN